MYYHFLVGTFYTLILVFLRHEVQCNDLTVPDNIYPLYTILSLLSILLFLYVSIKYRLYNHSGECFPFPLLCTLLGYCYILSIVVEPISLMRYFVASIVSIFILFTIPKELPFATKYVTILV